MGKIRRLVDKFANLEDGEEVTYYYTRFNDGTEEVPDVIITKCVFTANISDGGNYKDLVVMMYKEGDRYCYESEELYRMPFIEDSRVLEGLIREVSKQSHSEYAFLGD